MLEISDLTVTYGYVKALDAVSLSLAENEIVALVGSNGAGKSSLLKAIMGLAPVAGGTIRLGQEIVTHRRPFEIVRRGVGYAPEGRRVFTATSVIDNLRAGGMTLPRSAAEARIEQIVGYFPRLGERAQQRAGSLSGGEQQMLAIGRALMSRPRILLLDEPSLGLAPVIVQRIGALIREIQSAEGLAVIIAEQNVNWALRLADRGVVLELGRVRLAGRADELKGDDHVRHAYLGI